MNVPFQQVDVFTSVPYQGNPVAVIMDGNHLSTEQMQAIANWTNLSETTFVCEPQDPRADYRLRIFTPLSELPFAGHPTIGSAHAVLRHGIKPKTEGVLIQECGSGLITIFMEQDTLWLTLPEPRISTITATQQEQLASALGIEPHHILVSATIDVGPVWVTLQLPHASMVRELRPDFAAFASALPPSATGITVFGLDPDHPTAQVEVRSFAPTEGVDEDPVCGSGNGCVALLVREHGLIDANSYVAAQGRCVGRNGQVAVRYPEDGTILIGGHAVTCVEGSIYAP